MAPGTVAMSAFATAYVYVGIEELGVQVEQPFELIPMTRICAIVTAIVVGPARRRTQVAQAGSEGAPFVQVHHAIFYLSWRRSPRLPPTRA